ncbi:hypothetical protein D3877_00325 [Azospirillum cavernae]|uniref:DUF945 domain-containing protein n=1 Tax=Azospirillum cavernae TaxID=2320860 RepID=A0A418VZI7_9PROT|nr:hypothetical protein [Azospirillum cavernae]RJF83186.1 hypothetical protein D3877_00325 [Azospirillum cavernae]
MRRPSVRSVAPGLLAGGLFALVAAAWSPARADVPVVDDAGARALATTLKSGLTRWMPPASDDSEGFGFEWDGEPTVKASGDHYDIALPRLAAEGADGVRIEVGTVLLSVTPRDGGLFGVSVTLPGKIAVQSLDDEGEDYKDSASIALGRQTFTGTWSAPLETLLTMDGAFNDIAITSPDGKGAVTIGAVTLKQDLKADGPTTWSGPSAITISNVAALDEKKREAFKIAGLSVENAYSRADFTKISALQAMAQRVTATGKPPSVADVLPTLRGVIGGFTTRMSLTGLSGSDSADGSKVDLGQLTVTGGVTDLDQDFSTISLGMAARDFAITPSVAPTAFTPKTVEFGLSVAKLPNAALWQGLSDLALATEAEEKAKAAKSAKKDSKAKAAPAPATPLATPDAIIAKTMAALVEAGAELRLDALKVEAPATTATATGAMRVAAQSAFGVTGATTILLKGLDAAAKAMQPAPGAKPDKDAQDALGMIGMLQAMGQISKDESGAEIRSYKIEMTDSGQLLLNGADMAPLLGGGGEPAAPPADAGKKPKK